MLTKTYMLRCSHCSWKIITDGNIKLNDLVEIKRSPIQKTIPKWDDDKKQAIDGTNKEQGKLFRCPQCGRAVAPKKIEDPQRTIDKKHEEEAAAAQIAADREAALKEAAEAIEKRRAAQQEEFRRRRKKQ